MDLLASVFLDNLIRQKEETCNGKSRQLILRELDTSTLTRPWETWELDKDFFTVLSRWALKHPETTLDQVLVNISGGLEKGKELFNLIPEGLPIPVRGLVTALAHLFILGVKIARAKREVYEFVRIVVRWTGQIKTAFESAKGGQFTRSAWRDLRNMRDLIDEICQWAVDRLGDRRWTRIRYGLAIERELSEFRERIVDAQRLFQDLSAVNVARGMDSIKRDLRTLFCNQHVILTEVKKVRLSQERLLSHLANEMEIQKQAEAREQFFSETLATRTVTNPSYVQQEKRPCDPGTRIEVQTEIMQWANDIAPGSPNFLWLTGDPGCGKSAITASLARHCKDEDILWAQYFINRNNVETTDPNFYFPSIARQLANRSPDVAETIHDILKAQRSLMDVISTDQATKLFVDSVRHASLLEPGKPVVIVIDGLDETDRTRLGDTAVILSTLFNSLSAYPNVKVFISSRTEDEIRSPFTQPLHVNHVKHIHLDTSDPSSIRDVSTVIFRGLKKIVEKYDLNWEVWPGEARMETLGIKASGHFIWGVTAIKFVEEQIESHGEECLDHVLDMLTADTLHDINTLYELILHITLKDNAHKWELERFRRIVGAIVVLQEPLCLDDLAKLLDLRKTPDNDPVDLPHFVRRLRTVLVAGTDAISGRTVPRLHKSFFEFIISAHLDTRFRVEPQQANLELAVQCLRRLSSGHAALDRVKLSVPLRYACRFWSAHLSQTKQKTTRIIVADCSDGAMPVTRAVSLISAPVQFPLVLDISLSESRIQSTLGNNVRLWDITSGHGLPMRHRESVSCLAFSPDGKRIASCSTDKSIMVWDMEAGHCTTCIEHTSSVLAVAFSPNGKNIATGSSDHTVRLWDPHTGLSVGSPFRGHAGPVTCITFSPDGSLIVSGSEDRTCRLWNPQTGHSEHLLVGHSSPISSVTFSAPNGGYIDSGSDAGTVQTWKIGTSAPYGPCWRAHEGKVNSIAYPRHGGKFASSSDDGTVCHWSLDQQPARVRPPTTEHHSPVLAVTFTPDGKHILSGSCDTICVASAGGGQCITRRYGNTDNLGREGQLDVDSDPVTALAFSPDGRYFVCAGLTLRFYEIRLREGGSAVPKPVKTKKTGTHTTEFEFDIVPVDSPSPPRYDLVRASSSGVTAASYKQDALEELERALGSVEEDPWTYDAEVGNGRLNGIQCFRDRNSEAGGAPIWTFFDDRIIRADEGEGSVLVFDVGKYDP